MDNLDKFYAFKGHFQVVVKDVVSGKEWIHFEDHNTITYIAKRDAVRMFGGDNTTLRYIQKMKFTDQGYDYANSGVYPTTETSDLGVPLLYTASSLGVAYVDDYTVTNTSKVTFTAIMLTSQGNGSGSQNYSQAGLYTVDETLLNPPANDMATSGLFAIKNFAPVIKNANLQLTFNWSIIV